MKKWCMAGAITVLVTTSIVVSGCGARELAPPAAAVQKVLELRAGNSTDAAAYARYFEESAIATALAEDGSTRRAKESPIPEWETPTVKSSTETSAVVVVTWKPADTFKDWPETTTFVLTKAGGRWVVVDAAENRSEEATKTP